MTDQASLSSNPNLGVRNIVLQETSVRKKSIKELLNKYWSYSLLFVISITICLFLNFIFIHFRKPMYKSTVKILLKDPNGSEKGGGGGGQEIDITSLLLPNKPNLANEVEIVKSVSLMKRVVESLHLNTVCIFQGKVKNTEIYAPNVPPIITFIDISDSTKTYSIDLEIDGQKIYYNNNLKKQIVFNHQRLSSNGCSFIVNTDGVQVSNAIVKNYHVTWYPTNFIATKISNKLTSIPFNKEATILLLTYNSDLPNKARDILNSLVEVYSDYNIEQKNKTIDNTLQFIDDRLRLISQDLGGVEDDLLHYRETNKAFDLKAQTTAGVTKVDLLKERLDESQVKIKVCDILSEYVNNPKRKFNLIPSNLGIEDLTLVELVKEYNEDVSKREEQLKTLPEGNISIVEIESELEQLRNKIIEDIKNVKTAFKATYSSVEREYESTLEMINGVPKKEKVLLDIERQQAIKEKLYIYLLEKREESAISKAGAVSNSKPIDDAITDIDPVGATDEILWLLSLLLGIVFPLIIVLIRELFNDKIITKEDIHQNSNVPIIGEVSHLQDQKSPIVANSSRGVLPEQFRLIRTNLKYFFGEKEIQGGTILVTSTMKGEGKSFISLNLGAILALGGKKTIILEFDIRKPRVTKSLGLVNDKGISTFLIGKSTIDEIVRPIEGIDNYWVLSSGPIPPNPAELILLEDKMSELFNELTNRFDYVIVDSAPIGIVSDSRVLAKYSNLNLYIVRQRFTLKNQISFLDNLYTNKILPNMALIVNDVIGKGADSYYGYGGAGGYLYGGYYGYGYGYGYGYSYNYGYESDKEKKSKSFWNTIVPFFKSSTIKNK